VGEDDAEAQKTTLALATPPRKSARHMRWDVRYGSLADIRMRTCHVRFTLKIRHAQSRH
jgi:hypothetical protein